MSTEESLADELKSSKKYNSQLLLRVVELKERIVQLEKLQNQSKKTISELKEELAKRADYATVVAERDGLRGDLTIMFLTEQRLQQDLDYEASRVAMLRGLNERLMAQQKALRADFTMAESILRAHNESMREELILAKQKLKN